MSAQEYDGLLLPYVMDPNEATQLVPFLNDITEIHTTPVGMIALFGAPVYLDPAELGAALPLCRSMSGGLTSFPDSPKPESDALDCFLNGQNQIIQRKDWQPVDPLVFWDLDSIVVSHADPLPQNPTLSEAVPATAKTNWMLQSVFESKSILVEERDRISTIKLKRTRKAAGGLGRFGTLLIRLIFTFGAVYIAIGLIVTFLARLIFQATQGGNWFFSLLIFLGAVYLSIRFFTGSRGLAEKILRPGQQSGQQNNRTTQGRSAAPLASKSPGLFRKLNGWLIWNTPAGDQFRRGLEGRLSEMENLLKQGKIDDALKRAISVAQKENSQKSARASRLPDIRSSLGLNFGTQLSGSEIPMGKDAHLQMRQMYRNLAEDCERKGEYVRAAFIYDELLGDHKEAVRVLEEAKRFEDAAKLAVARNLDGGLIVRLWYLAGERDIAIALAERHSCFDTLVKTAEDKSQQAGHFIRKIWAERLVAVGDVSKALLVTDPLPGFDEVRLRWLVLAIGQGELENPEIFHRAVLTLPWRVEILSRVAKIAPHTVGDALEARISEVLDQSEAAEGRMAVLDYFVAEVSKQNSQKDRFQKPNTALFCELLIRRVIADGVPLTGKSIQDYIRLARVAGHDLLAVDLQHIRRAQPKTPASEVVLALPTASPTQPKWQHIVCLPQRRVLLGDDTGILRIVHPNGKVEWSDYVTDLAGLVRIRTGLFVLLVLGKDAGRPRRVVMLNTLSHKYTQIGQLNLEAWHSESNEHLWLVKSGQRIQALSIAALFKEAPEFNESWGITITEKIIVLGFLHNDQNIGWYHQRCEGNAGFGLIEYWTASTRTLSFSTYLLVPRSKENPLRVDIYTEPTALRGSIYALSGDNAGKAIHANLRSYSWEDETALKTAHFHFFQSLDAPAPMRSYAMGPLVTEMPLAVASRIKLVRQGPETLICLEKCHWIASDTAHGGRSWVIIDNDHRVIFINPVTYDIQVQS